MTCIGCVMGMLYMVMLHLSSLVEPSSWERLMLYWETIVYDVYWLHSVYIMLYSHTAATCVS